MATSNRLTTLLESIKNAVVILGIPALGIYMWRYHQSQVELKDSVIALQQAQLSQAQEFSVETANERLIAMKNLYETLLASTSDSLDHQALLLDSLSRALNTSDTTARQYGNMVILPYDHFVHMAAIRSVMNDLLKECRAENKMLLEGLKEIAGDRN